MANAWAKTPAGTVLLFDEEKLDPSWVPATDAEIAEAKQTVIAKDADGRIRSVPSWVAIADNMIPTDDAETDRYLAAKKEAGEGFGSTLGTVVESALSSASFGATPWIAKQTLGRIAPETFGEEAQRLRREENPIAELVGAVGGAFIPTGAGLLGGAAKGANWLGAAKTAAAIEKVAAPAVTLPGKIAQGVGYGVAGAVQQQIDEKALGRDTVGVGEGLALGAGLGFALPVVGEVIAPVARAIGESKVGQAVSTAIPRWGSSAAERFTGTIRGIEAGDKERALDILRKKANGQIVTAEDLAFAEGVRDKLGRGFEDQLLLEAPAGSLTPAETRRVTSIDPDEPVSFAARLQAEKMFPSSVEKRKADIARMDAESAGSSVSTEDNFLPAVRSNLLSAEAPMKVAQDAQAEVESFTRTLRETGGKDLTPEKLATHAADVQTKVGNVIDETESIVQRVEDEELPTIAKQMDEYVTRTAQTEAAEKGLTEKQAKELVKEKIAKLDETRIAKLRAAMDDGIAPNYLEDSKDVTGQASERLKAALARIEKDRLKTILDESQVSTKRLEALWKQAEREFGEGADKVRSWDRYRTIRKIDDELEILRKSAPAASDLRQAIQGARDEIGVYMGRLAPRTLEKRGGIEFNRWTRRYNWAKSEADKAGQTIDEWESAPEAKELFERWLREDAKNKADAKTFVGDEVLPLAELNPSIQKEATRLGVVENGNVSLGKLIQSKQNELDNFRSTASTLNKKLFTKRSMANDEVIWEAKDPNTVAKLFGDIDNAVNTKEELAKLNDMFAGYVRELGTEAQKFGSKKAADIARALEGIQSAQTLAKAAKNLRKGETGSLVPTLGEGLTSAGLGYAGFTVGGIPGAIAGAGLGLGTKLVKDIAYGDPAATIAKLVQIEQAITKLENKVGGVAGKIVALPFKGIRGAAGIAGSTAVGVGKAGKYGVTRGVPAATKFGIGLNKNERKRERERIEKEFLKNKKKLTGTSTTMLLEQLGKETEGWADVAPKTALAYTETKARANTFLRSKLPNQQQIMGRDLPLSDSQMAKFNRYAEANSDPLNAILNPDGSVNEEALETLKVVYPSVLQMLTQDLIELVAKSIQKQERLDPIALANVRRITGLDMSGQDSVAKSIKTRMESGSAGAVAVAVSGSGASAQRTYAKATPARADKLKSGERYLNDRDVLLS